MPKRTFTSFVNSTPGKTVNPKSTKQTEESKNQELTWMKKRNESWDY